ncbi:MAG: hypothetical protein JAY75_18430, partial [Candidatus Thiodiazotropha taylori]|nr:hypothetical protein [Candidatus Thiodiazotropha taylori]MCW4310195.1 hypothetical protein [Candidatus Thiodiazotropha endolucinida]
MPRKRNWKKSLAKTVVRADAGSPGLHISDVGLTHLLDHGGSKPHSPVAMGTSEPGSQILSDVGMTCLSVSSDPGSTNISDVGMTCLIVTSDAMKTHVASAQSTTHSNTHVASAQSTTISKTHVASAQCTSDKDIHRKQSVQTAKVLQNTNDKNMKTHVATVLQSRNDKNSDRKQSKSEILQCTNDTESNRKEAVQNIEVLPSTNDKDVNRKQLVQDTNIHSPLEVTNTVFSSSTQVGEQAMYTAFPLTEQTETMLWKPIGPFNSVKFEQGSFHQGSEIFSEESRGCQCTANALCSLIYAAYSDISCSADLDNILLAGDCLYNKVIYELKAKGKFRSKLLSFDELPRLVSILNKDVVVKTSAIVTGLCTEQFVNTSLPTLHQALYTALQYYHGVLLMIGSICSAVFKRDGKYFIFDSHSHGFNGLSAPDGKSLLAGFNCLDDLVSFLYALFESMMISISTQFEILPVDFDLSSLEHVSVFDIENPSTCHTNTPCDYGWKTVTYKRNLSESHIKNAHAREDFFAHSNSENHATLIGKYFKDQKRRLEDKTCNSIKVTKKRNNEIKKNMKKATERKEYMKAYMQKRRQDTNFKVKDKMYTLKSKQSARQSEEYRKKDREYTLKSKQSARQSEEYRKKDREYTLKSKQSARQSE